MCQGGRGGLVNTVTTKGVVFRPTVPHRVPHRELDAPRCDIKTSAWEGGLGAAQREGRVGGLKFGKGR